ncbi:MAG: TIGR02206 family membrane protein [FCB group bacterium]|nr:TIGR02206 family membrane protein [FCB group bacterium]
MIEHEIIPLFGPLWWKAILTTGLGVFILLYLGKKLPPKTVEKMTRVIGIFLIFVAVGMQPYEMWVGKWTVQSSLPLQMCGISAWLSGFALLYKPMWIYYIVFYWGIPGAFHSLMTPEFTLGTQGIFFYEYYISHGGIILAALWATLILKRRPAEWSWLKMFAWTQLVLPVIGSINWLLDANYMYICKPPIVDNPFIVGQFPYHLIVLEFAALLHFMIVYAPFGISRWRKKHQSAPAS